MSCTFKLRKVTIFVENNQHFDAKLFGQCEKINTQQITKHNFSYICEAFNTVPAHQNTKLL